MIWFLFHANLDNVLFQRCVIVWNLVLIEMHMLMVCINGFHSFEVASILPKCVINGCKNGGNVVRWLEVWIVRIWMEIAPWRAWRLRRYAGIWQRNEMVKRGVKSESNWSCRRSAVSSRLADCWPTANRPCVGQNYSNSISARGVVGPRAVSRRLADLRKKLKSSILLISRSAVGRLVGQPTSTRRPAAR